jgi:hypothetical protein
VLDSEDDIMVSSDSDTEERKQQVRFLLNRLEQYRQRKRAKATKAIDSETLS